VLLRVLPQSLQSNAGVVPKLQPQSSPSKSFPIHYSLIALTFNAIESKMLKASSNILQTNKIHVASGNIGYRAAVVVMEAVNASEMSVSIYQIIPRNIPEDSHLLTRRGN
jgi:hypothetical protein